MSLKGIIHGFYEYQSLLSDYLKMSSQTFHTTAQDLRKQETRSGTKHNGQTPKDAEVSQLKVS